MAQHEIRVEITADGSKAIAESGKVKGELKGVKNVKIPNPFGEVSNGAKKASSDVDALGGALGKIRNMVAGAFAVGSIYSFGKAALSAAAKTELLHKGLSFVLNSDEEASRLVKNIQDIGEASAYDTTQLLPLARAWVNIGDNVDTATSKMQKIVDLGSAYGLTSEQVGAVNLALTQMQMAGKIGQQDMMQLINAGIPAWQLLSEKMGIPVEQLKDMSSKSELTQDALQTLWDEITEKTEGAASSMSDTLSAKFSNAQEAVANSMSAMGDIISQAFNVPGVLDAAGEMAEGFKTHINSIRDAAKDVGLHDAIVQELEGISPAAAAAADGVMTAFTSMKDTIMENQTAVTIVVEAIGAMAATVAIIKGVQTAFLAAKGAAMAFALACQANPIILAISAVIAILVLLYTHWDEMKAIALSVRDAVVDAVSDMAASVRQKFDEAVNYAKGIWQGLKDFMAHPIDTVVNVIRRNVDGGSEGVTPAGRAKGGVFGMARGGIAGGLVPLANGGQLKHGTPAIVGEAGPEAVLPLRENVLASIGKAVAASYNVGKSKYTNPSAEITAKIKSQANTGPVSAYAKILEEAQKRAQAVGEAVAKYGELQKKANEELEAYVDGGEKAIQYQQKMAQLSGQIAKAQAGGNEEQASLLQQKQANLEASYAKEKAAAIKAAQDIAAEKKNIEIESANAISAIQIEAIEKVNARETAVKEAQRQLDSASHAASLEEFTAMMEEKDAITGESYATILANEQALNDMRQIWHEQMMLNAMEWGEYMNLTLAQVQEQLVNGIAQGLTQCIVYGKNFRDIMNNLANNVLSTVLQAVLQKAIGSLMTMIGLGKTKTAQEVASAAKEKAAQAAKSGTLAANATAALIAANPWAAPAAAGIVAGQMGAARAAGSVFKDGGFVTGPGTGTSDSIPAMLSNGEFVINAAAVQRLGTGYLNMLNSPHYAEGGQVGTPAMGAAGSGGSVTLNVSAMDASSFMDFLRGGGMDSIKQMLFDGTRDFTTDAGVW